MHGTRLIVLWEIKDVTGFKVWRWAVTSNMLLTDWLKKKLVGSRENMNLPLTLALNFNSVGLLSCLVDTEEVMICLLTVRNPILANRIAKMTRTTVETIPPVTVVYSEWWGRGRRIWRNCECGSDTRPWFLFWKSIKYKSNELNHNKKQPRKTLVISLFWQICLNCQINSLNAELRDQYHVSCLGCFIWGFLERIWVAMLANATTMMRQQFISSESYYNTCFWNNMDSCFI